MLTRKSRHKTGKNQMKGINRSRFNILATACLVCVSPFTQAEDLLQVLTLAQQNDPKYLAAGFSLQASKQALPQAESKYFPTLSFDAESTETEQNIISSENTVFDSGTSKFPTTQYSLTVSQPIFQWSYVVGIRQADAVVKKADAEYQTANQDLILRTVQRYLDVLKAQDALQFSNAEKQAIKKQLELVSVQKRAGKVRRTDLLDVKARYANAVSGQIEADYAIKDAFEALTESTGVNLSTLLALKKNIPLQLPDAATAEERVKQALSNNPAMIAQQHQLDVTFQEVERQQSGHYPTLDLVARSNRKETGGTLFGGGSDVETNDIMLRFNLPLYQGGYVSSRHTEANKLYFKAKEELEELRRSITRQTRSAYFGVISAISRVEALQTSVDAQALTLESKRRGYRSGLYTNLAVLDAERDLHMAKRDFSEAIHDYFLNALRLEHAIGDLTIADVQRINTWFE